MLRVRFEMPAKKIIVWRFAHGRYADLWSILHIASGFSAGLLGLLLGWSTPTIISISILGFFLYELWEALIGIVEDVENALTDVASCFFGTYLALHYFAHKGFSYSHLKLWFGISLAIDAALLFTGYKMFLGRILRGEVHRPYPSWKSKAGRRKIKQDQILFFGLALVSVPLAQIYDSFGQASAIAAAAAGVFLVFYSRAKIR